MPVHVRHMTDRHADDEDYRTLRQRLIDEWKGASEPNGAGPDIYEERRSGGTLINVVVVWDAWADLSDEVRSEMIVEALEAVKGEDAVLDLALAIGLTKAQAARRGL